MFKPLKKSKRLYLQTRKYMKWVKEKTKKKLTPFLGPDAIVEFSHLCDLPFTVMGGIKLAHVPELVARGAKRLAVVTALTETADIAVETRRWIETIERELQQGG